MTSKDALISALTSTKGILNMFMADLADADLQVRPVPGANNIAWQMAHLIASETGLGKELGFEYPKLPPILEKMGSGKSSQTHPDGGNLSKAQYVSLFNDVRAATIAGVAKMPEAALDEPNTGPMAGFAPKKADLIILVANHAMMHAGQFSVVRRLLGKPVLM